MYSIYNGIVKHNEAFLGLGNTLVIEYNINGRIYNVVYAHLKAAYPSKGQYVTKGAVIGIVGQTGCGANLWACNEHLHFEILTQPFSGTMYSRRPFAKPIGELFPNLYVGKRL